MIIPIRCFTCGNVLADKWREYERRCQELHNKDASVEDISDSPAIASSVKIPPNFGKKFHGKILDNLGLNKICCRRHMLGHVDMMETI